MGSKKVSGLQEVGARGGPAVVRADETDLPALETLLASGGDSRIALDTAGRNRYGCGARPDPGLAAFGSSTASTISAAGFEAARALRQKIRFAARTEPAPAIYARELERVRRELISLSAADDLGVDLIFAASGTDLHLILAGLAAGAEHAPLLAITGAANETGSSVAAALGGRHFSDRTALGAVVAEGAPIAGGGGAEVATIAPRLPDGVVRSAAEIDAEVEALAEQAVASGRRVLLFLLDQSKTGLIAPSVDCALRLARRFAEALDVVVDACQLRLAASTVRAYLAQGFAVALTGSKFASGPAFSGAVLLPRPMATRFRARAIPASLLGYSARADWPGDWRPARSLSLTASWGLLLRWEAALEELRSLRAVPPAEVTRILRSFAEAVAGRCAMDSRIVPLPTRALERGALATGPSWDEIPTIFPFVLRDAGGRWLTRDETAVVHRELSRGAARCELGQPVPAGIRDGTPVAALRLCASARLVAEAHAGGAVGERAVIARAIAALDRTATIAADLGARR